MIITSITHWCPHCYSTNIVKNGHTRHGNQRCLCHDCGKPRVPDDLWHKIEIILQELDPPAQTGRRRIDQRAALDGMIYRLRTGCQCNQLPNDFPDDASVHRTMQRWINRQVFPALWALLVEACDELGGVDFEWQAADGAMGKPAMGETM